MMRIPDPTPAGDDEQLASDEGCLRRCEEDRAAGDVVGRAPALERRLRHERGVAGAVGIAERIAAHRRLNQPGEQCGVVLAGVAEVTLGPPPA